MSRAARRRSCVAREPTPGRSSGSPASTLREAAEALRGEELRCARAEAPELGPDEFWAEDFPGCAVVDGERRVGTVRRMVGLPSCEMLEVDREGGGELLVPLVRDAVRSIDLAAARIDVDLRFFGEAPQ